jgi:hypothetical protein
MSGFRLATAARIALVLLPLALACQARAESVPPDAPETVRVTGVRAIPWKSYRAMRAAMDARDEYQDLAPNARLSFGIVLPPGQKLPPNFAMRVRTPDGKEYPVEMTGNLFQVPVLPGDLRDADLVTNLKGVPVKIGLQVVTPDLPPGMDRLGDLRLYCEMMDAIDRVDEGVLKRLLRPDPCKRPGAAQWFAVPLARPTSGGALVEGERNAELARRDDQGGTYYDIPLGDSSWGNDALVAYGYLEPFPANRGRGRLRFKGKD